MLTMAHIAKSAYVAVNEARDEISQRCPGRGEGMKDYCKDILAKMKLKNEPGSEHLDDDSVAFLLLIKDELFAERNLIAHELNEGDWAAWEDDKREVLVCGRKWRMSCRRMAVEFYWKKLSRFARVQDKEKPDRMRDEFLRAVTGTGSIMSRASRSSRA